MSNWQTKSLSFAKSWPHNNWEWFSSCVIKFWYMYLLAYLKFEKRWENVFQIYLLNAIHFNPLQFCPSTSLLGVPVFCKSSSIVLSHYFGILVNCMTIWSVLKLPKIAWPSPCKGGIVELQIKFILSIKGPLNKLSHNKCSGICLLSFCRTLNF